ncbi:4'-phosphopantetheinyl transferase family protein [Leptolyngbya ohadii]|uniref:4'-phosphopantetheinyl transferase family protein n=1 Tax=Leptolyngbya ohadii TaxID=1962290 RepID=UPI000B59E62D|nr:4'-phosphopantetheinyl transferase superfamily protein [Leptolyngbya ohadii]
MLDVCAWALPPARSQLSAQEVHLWQADLVRPDVELEELTPLLSEDEQQRASRFRFERDRRKYIICRGILRTLLSRYLQRDPIDLTFSYSKYGKPFLNESPVSFNLAHSGDRALYAVVLNHAIGVDIEQLRSVEHIKQIVSRYFAPEEQQAFQLLDPAQQQIAFFRGWTAKEAFLKAIGSGLSQSPHQIAVTLLPDQAAKLLSLPAEYFVREWQLFQFVPTEGYMGAIVLPQEPLQLRCFQI